MTMEQEIEAAARTFQKFGQVMQGEVKRVTALGGYYFASAAEAAAPTGTKIHKRYSTAKVSKSMRAPKGSGNVVATYMPGNLKRSIRVLDLKRAKNASYVGAKLNKGPATGTFSGTRADGYYMHMVERGTKNWQGSPFFVAAWNRAKPRVTAIMVNEFERVILKFERENAVNSGQLSLF